MRKTSRKTSIVAMIVALLLVIAVLLARTRPWMHQLNRKTYVQGAAGGPHPPSFGECWGQMRPRLPDLPNKFGKTSTFFGASRFA